MQKEVTNIAAATALILNGPDKWSLDRALGLHHPRWLTPLGLVAVLYARNGEEEAPEEDGAREGAAGDAEA